MTAEQIAIVAEQLRAAGLPDFLNRWVAMTPDEWTANELARERLRKYLHTAAVPRAQTIEPEGRAILREMQVTARRKTHERLSQLKEKKAMTKKAAGTKESALREQREATTTDKQESDVTTKKERRKAAPAKTAQRSKARSKVEVRPGSKLEKVAELLMRKSGCTTKDVLAATGWPAVSMPQQAKAAGLTLRKEKVDGVTWYFGTR